MGHPPSRSHGLQRLHPCQHLELSVLITAILRPHGVKPDYTQQPRVLNHHKSLRIQDRFSQALGSFPRHLKTHVLTQHQMGPSLDPGTPGCPGIWGCGWGIGSCWLCLEALLGVVMETAVATAPFCPVLLLTNSLIILQKAFWKITSPVASSWPKLMRKDCGDIFIDHERRESYGPFVHFCCIYVLCIKE